MPSPLFLAQHTHPLGGFFLAEQPDGTWRAGRSEQQTRTFPNLQALYDCMYPLAVSGHHWAWNLCYEAQALIEAGAP